MKKTESNREQLGIARSPENNTQRNYVDYRPNKNGRPDSSNLINSNNNSKSFNQP